MTQRSPFRYVETSPEIIRLAVMLYVWFPRWLRKVDDLLHERVPESAMRQRGIGGAGLGTLAPPKPKATS
jgi:hypothetical protein